MLEEPSAESSTARAKAGWLARMPDPADDAARRERRDELAAVLETALDCIIIMDAAGRIQEFNPAAERTFGYRREEVIGELLAEKIIPPALREMHQRGLTRYLETGEARVLGRRIEVQAMRADGREFPAELAITAIRHGERPLFTAYLRDLTEARLLAQVNEAAVRRWRLLFDRSPVSVQIFAPDGTTLAVNEEWEKIFLAPRDRILGWNVLTDNQLGASGAQAIIARAFAGEVVVVPPERYVLGANPVLGRDPAAPPIEKWIGALLYPVHDEAGRIVEVVCIHDDATERRRAEQKILELNAGLERQVADRTAALDESRERFYKLFHANPAMMTLLRLSDRRLVDVNDAFCRASDHPRENALGRTYDELRIWTDPEARAEFERRLATVGCVRDMAITFLSGTGRRDHVLLSAEVIEMNGEPHLLTVALDLNARQRAEEVMREALAAEREANRLKSNFVSMVSHEFRTPLGIILSSSEIIDRYLDSLDPAERREQLDAIRTSVGRMTGLIEQVLMFSRIEAGLLECRAQPLDLAAFCAGLADELRSATAHRCPIELAVATPLADAAGDEKLLRHIFTNLLTNAVKYSRPGDAVRFTVRRAGPIAHFEVSDTGLGIPEAELEHLCTAFRRARNVADLPGTGLGLVIVRKCLDAHGGDLHFESVEDQGTTVRVTLPLFPET